jgi:tetratricopeptide (TPR) repeat protein
MAALVKAICIQLLAGLLLIGVAHADVDSGMAAFRAGDYKTAVPLLSAAAGSDPKNAAVRAALLSALVYEGKLEEASEAADLAAANFPNSPEVTAARGEFAFYMGDVPQAEKLFKDALKIHDSTPRAYYGLSRLYRAASLFRSARLLCLKAHELDPDDAYITLGWLRYVPREKREELAGSFAAAHPWFYRNLQQQESTASILRNEVGERRAFEPDGERTEPTLKLELLMSSPTRPRGVGLQLSIEGHRPLRVLLDTGASGILLTQAAIDKAGLNHVGTSEAWGIGDRGPKKTFLSVAQTCQIGSLKYKTCVFEAIEGKGRIAGDEDGLLGADVFSDYLIQLDFQRHQMHLTPLPPRPPDPQGYDRTIPPEEAGFTKVFRSGSHLFVPTKFNDKLWGLFLLDTGAALVNVDTTFAQLATKLHGDSYMRVRGVSGEVKDVFEADKAYLQFSHFRQNNLGLTAFNLNNSPDHQEFRISGVLGLPVLAMFRLTLDYRNGLVNFDYVH